MTISTSSRLLVAGTVLLATSTHVKGIDNLKSVSRVKAEAVTTKDDDEDIEAFASGVLRKKRESNVETVESGASPNNVDHKRDVVGTLFKTVHSSTHPSGFKSRSVHQDAALLRKKQWNVEMAKAESRALEMSHDGNSKTPNHKNSMDNPSKADSPTKPKSHPIRPDSGALKVGHNVGSLHDENKAPLRQEFAPYLLSDKHSKTKALSSHLHLHRRVQVSGSCNATEACLGSDPICAKDGSCNYQFACRFSPNLQAESGACNSTSACSLSPGMVVGEESCGAGGAQSLSCSESPEACVGLRSCQGDSDFGACSYSEGIHVSDDSCLGAACFDSPNAVIEHESCHEFLACVRSDNIIVGQFSCRSLRACSSSGKTTIGQYSCNCPYCCQYLESGCEIPDFSCNDGPGSCSFNQTSLGCPNFTF